MIDFSIVIPTYNQADLLLRCLKSVRKQTFSNWEAIIINNRSTDNTLEVISSFQEKRFKLLNYTNKGIIASSRNLGIKYAKGKYISFLDSDDFWYENKLEEVYAVISKDYDLVCHAEAWINEKKFVKNVVYGPESKASYYHLLFFGNTFSTSAVTVRASYLRLFNGFNESRKITGVEDYELWLRIMKNNPRIYFIQEALGVYYLHRASTSRSIYRQFYSELSVLNLNFSNFDKFKLYFIILIILRYVRLLVSSFRQLFLYLFL